jgi:hypothetical protein
MSTTPNLASDEEVASRLVADADDHAVQVAFAIESIADEVAQLIRDLEMLREAVNEQRVLLDELRARQR